MIYRFSADGEADAPSQKTVAALMLATVSTGASAFYPGFPPPGYAAVSAGVSKPAARRGLPVLCLLAAQATYPWFARPQVDHPAWPERRPPQNNGSAGSMTNRPPGRQTTDADIDADALASSGGNSSSNRLPLIDRGKPAHPGAQAGPCELSARLEAVTRPAGQSVKPA